MCKVISVLLPLHFPKSNSGVVRPVMLHVDLELDNEECHKNAFKCHKGKCQRGKISNFVLW